MAGEVTKEELRADIRDLRESVVSEMRAGFLGVHARQDIANGRLNKLDVESGRHEVRIKGLEKEVFDRPNRRRGDSDGEERDELRVERRSAITQRDVKIAIGTIGAGYGLAKGLGWLLPLLLAAGQGPR